ncbi:MAG TPA: thioredoxin domain-containing protein [Candidatus Angelobacter sp.]|jgi:protein-disulfide isomerase|nr:thioredoxin domain-containing protein [Candidatus Angelobacter sp.]
MKKLIHLILAFAVFLGLSVLCFATDFSAIKPPPGVKVVVVVFEDLQCPSCAHAYPIIWDVAKAHNVPVLLHDYPLTNIHPWTFRASLYARYFDTQSQKLGDDFRGYIYKNQSQIVPGNLDQYARKYADANKIALPFSIDPQGKLKEKVDADYELGNRVGVHETPTIFVVGNSGTSEPLVEQVKAQPNDLAQTFTQMVEDMQKKAVAPPSATPVKHAAGKSHKKKPS